MEIELIARVHIDGGGRFSQIFEGSAEFPNRKTALHALNKQYGYENGLIPFEDRTSIPGHQEATHRLIGNHYFKVKCDVLPDGTIKLIGV